MHPDAAMLPSHKDCGEACLARGVPLAIVNEADGQMYFAADGSGRLTRFHQKRVSAEGIAVRKKEPLELKMPVGSLDHQAGSLQRRARLVSAVLLAR